jgi:RND family efflux transporter, MFP subunit
MKKKYLVPALVLSTALVLTGCQKTDETAIASAPQTKVENTIAVAVKKPTRGRVENSITLNGSLISKTVNDIVAENSGKITSCTAAYGDTVEKDQVIALIDPSKPGLKYEKTELRAPAAGTVTEIYFKDGSYVGPGASLGKVTDLNDLRLSVYIPEQYAATVTKGESVKLTLEAYPGKVFDGNIVFLDPTIDRQSRTRNAEIEIATGEELLIGMHARVKLTVAENDEALLISKAALIEESGEKYVYTVVDGRARKTVVETGLYDDDSIEILSGLTDSDSVVVKGQQLLFDGTKVNV